MPDKPYGHAESGDGRIERSFDTPQDFIDWIHQNYAGAQVRLVIHDFIQERPRDFVDVHYPYRVVELHPKLGKWYGDVNA